jgi:hypothetical protein
VDPEIDDVGRAEPAVSAQCGADPGHFPSFRVERVTLSALRAVYRWGPPTRRSFVESRRKGSSKSRPRRVTSLSYFAGCKDHERVRISAPVLPYEEDKRSRPNPPMWNGSRRTTACQECGRRWPRGHRAGVCTTCCAQALGITSLP